MLRDGGLAMWIERLCRWGVLCGALAVFGASSGAGQRADELPLTDLLEVVLVGRDLVAFDAESGGQTTERLHLGEEILWRGSRGKVGIVITNERVLAVATRSASWQEARYLQTEIPPAGALLGDRVALVLTSQRALGFDASASNLSEYRLGPGEDVVAREVGENTVVVVTDREALGLAPVGAGFITRKLQLHERVQSVRARANLATVTTNRRILVFRGTTASWGERRVGIN